MKNFRMIRDLLKYTALLASVLVVAVACGGGGGGGGGVSNPIYTGVITPAVITDANKEELVEDTWLAADTSEINPLGVVASPTEQAQAASLLPGLLTMLTRLGENLDVAAIGDQPVSVVGATIEDSDTIIGDCSGSMTYSGSYDDVTGDFNFDLSFNKLDDCDDVMNGQATMSGKLDLSGDVLKALSFKFSFNQLTFSEAGESITMNGSLELTVSATGGAVAMKMDYRDNNAGKVYRIDYTVVATSTTMSISGRFYHPDHGYIEVTTPTTLTVSSSDDYPSSGQLVITGGPADTGSFAATKLRVTFLSGGNYTLEADLDGNTGYEQSESCNWTSGCV